MLFLSTLQLHPYLFTFTRPNRNRNTPYSANASPPLLGQPDCCGVEGGRERYDGADGPDHDQGDDHHLLGRLGPERSDDGSPPLQSDGKHGEHTDRHLLSKLINQSKIINNLNAMLNDHLVPRLWEHSVSTVCLLNITSEFDLINVFIIQIV